jgi:PPM family protein phosphatase
MRNFHASMALEGQSKQCEDRAAVWIFHENLIVIVADGAGGIGGGAYAARMIIQCASERICEIFEFSQSETWIKLLHELDWLLAEDPEAGEAAAVLLAIHSDGITGASVGDCGAWLIAGQEYQDLTQEQQRKPLLGSGEAFPVGFSVLPFVGTLLVASDGLFNYTTPQNICEAVGSASTNECSPEKLIDLVRLRSGQLQDDISVVLSSMNGP